MMSNKALEALHAASATYRRELEQINAVLVTNRLCDVPASRDAWFCLVLFSGLLRMIPTTF